MASAATGNSDNSTAPVRVEVPKGVQEGSPAVGQQLSQHAPVSPRAELLGAAGVAAVYGRQADVEVPQQDHSMPGLPQSPDARQQRLRMPKSAQALSMAL